MHADKLGSATIKRRGLNFVIDSFLLSLLCRKSLRVEERHILHLHITSGLKAAKRKPEIRDDPEPERSGGRWWTCLNPVEKQPRCLLLLSVRTSNLLRDCVTADNINMFSGMAVFTL